MFKEFLRSVEGIETLPVIALIIFFTIFVGVLVYVTFMSKDHVEKMMGLPFEGSKNSLNNRGKNG
ncbi:MAG: cbb3-type cytochrome c oxidase subunit 3 [Proteobacteria bacterium]|nr:cbb3-type cytochrome c oxidase subunit 3 [Pseudomonadota bacterium]